jgi:hypothetical protein
MSRLRSDSGFALTALIIGVGSVLAGGAAAAVAIASVIHSYGPHDSNARQHGYKEIRPPEAILSYGG